MKFGNLKSLGHNLADSMASGIGFVIGIYGMNVFAEAAASNEGHITVNFLSGTTTGAIPSASLGHAICLYRDELPRMCVKHGIDLTKIKTLEARFGTDQTYGPHFKVTVETLQGKTSTEQYIGLSGRRLRRRKQ